MWSPWESGFSLVPPVAVEHELPLLPHLETRGVVLLYPHASQSLTRGWCRVVSYLLRWCPFTEDSSLEKGTVVISLQQNHTAAGRRMHSLLTDQGTAATLSPAITKIISLCCPERQPLKSTWCFLNMPSTSIIPCLFWNNFSTLSNCPSPAQPSL